MSHVIYYKEEEEKKASNLIYLLDYFGNFVRLVKREVVA